MLVSVKEYKEKTEPDYRKIMTRRCVCPKCGSTKHSIMHSDVDLYRLDGTPKVLHSDVRCLNPKCGFKYSIFVKTNEYLRYRIMGEFIRGLITILLMLGEMLAIVNF